MPVNGLNAQNQSGDKGDSWVIDGYPYSSRRFEEEGTVKVQLEVSTKGRVSDCKVIESSGFANLDNNACEQLKKGARFKPARDSQGNTVVGYFETSVRYQLDK